MNIVCSGCGESVKMKDVEQPRLVNLLNVSMIVLHHDQTAYCQNCRAEVGVVISGIEGLTLNAARLPNQVEPKIIAPPKGFKAN